MAYRVEFHTQIDPWCEEPFAVVELPCLPRKGDYVWLNVDKDRGEYRVVKVVMSATVGDHGAQENRFCVEVEATGAQG